MDAKTIKTRLQELAFLNSDATIWFRALQHSKLGASSSSSSSNGASPAMDSITATSSSSSNGNGAAPHAEAPAVAAAAGGDGAAQGGWEKLHFSGGLREYVKHLNRDLAPMHEPLYISDKVQSRVLACACVHACTSLEVLAEVIFDARVSQKVPSCLTCWRIQPTEEPTVR